MNVTIDMYATAAVRG